MSISRDSFFWDSMMEQCCDAHSCGITQMRAASKKEQRKLEKQREQIERATLAVQRALAQQPNASKEEARKLAYKFLSGGLIGILLQQFLPLLLKKAVEWLLQRLYP